MARNILVVEDDRNISELIRMYLEKEGFEVRLAYDGGKAVEEFDRQQPDMVLLDIKYTNNADYQKYVGCSLNSVLQFLDYLQNVQIPALLRQVIIPTKNDSEQNILLLKEIAAAHPNVTAVELLPFKKICQVKYDKMGLVFPFGDLPVPDRQTMERLNILL